MPARARLQVRIVRRRRRPARAIAVPRLQDLPHTRWALLQALRLALVTSALAGPVAIGLRQLLSHP